MKYLLALSLSLLASVASAQSFGKQWPHANSAVSYLYGANGTFLPKTGIQYNHSFYYAPHYADIGVTCDQPIQPPNHNDVIAYAKLYPHTSPDADCLMIADLNNNLSISDERPAPSAKSFVEHTAKGAGGVPYGDPFLQFWFDDNWLARIMAQTYGQQLPTGLHDNNYRIRWRVLEGSNAGWANYTNDAFIDRLAINGLAFANDGNWNAALVNWDKILNDYAHPVWNATTRRYDYSFSETYYIGLWLAFTERLYADGVGYSTTTRRTLLQHAVSLHLLLLATQEMASGGSRIGWRTSFNVSPNVSVINTETTTLSVLGLAAEALRVYEAGFGPLGRCSTCGFTTSTSGKYEFATVAASSAGHMAYGPYSPLPVGSYTANFTLRLPNGCSSCGSNAVTIDVYDGTNIVASSVLLGSSFNGAEWSRFPLSFTVTNAAAPYEFRVWYHDNMNVDASSIRVN